ncbi:S1 family peptidase [Streptosporangium sandarakinum]|uniref:S1 family peptidase n=1 Tax=Streptosporangium sandarakinum TaxID=1260955 RepID=UPI0036B91590
MSIIRKFLAPLSVVLVAVVVNMFGAGPARAVRGADPVPADRYLFTAQIQNDRASCSGVLVDPSWVLTAADCFAEGTQPPKAGAPSRPTTVIVGRTDLTASGGNVTSVTALVPHSARRVVLAQLAQPVTTVTPVTLGEAPTAGEQLLAAGFGRTATEWVPDKLYAGTFTVQGVTADSVNIDDAGAGLCRGDSGGPLLRDVGGVAQLVALHERSWQGGCLAESETRRTATEVRVDDLGGWIYTVTGDDYVALSPGGTLLDTRDGTGAPAGPRAGGSTTTFPVLGKGGVPDSGVSAVLVDVTAIDPSTSMYLTVFSEGTQRPITSTVNTNPGEGVSSTQVVKPGASGKLSVYASGGSTHIMVDVHGYFTSTPGVGGGFVAIPHYRVGDTRDGTGTTVGTVPSGGTRTFSLAGSPVPADATSAVLDVVVVGATGTGYLTAYPAGGTADPKSIMDYPKGVTSQGIVVKLSADRRVTLGNRGSSVHLVITVQGYVTATPDTGNGLRMLSPTRLLDTRANGGAAIPANGTLAVQIGGTSGIPQRGMNGAFLNLTVVSPTASGHLMVSPDNGMTPGLSSLANFTAGQHARSTMVVVKAGSRDPRHGLGIDGGVVIKNLSSVPVHLVVDLHGWFGQPQVHSMAGAVPVTDDRVRIADNGGSIVEDYSYPAAAEILATQNVRLISGDGHILLVDCATAPQGDIGLLKVYTTEEPIGADGIGRVCFKVSAPSGWLNLEVPGVYEIRGDGLRTGKGHEVTAELKNDEGDEVTVECDPDGSTQVGMGADPQAPPTTLLRLTVTG